MNAPELMLTAEVAALFRVAPVTVTRWVKARQLEAIRTPGGDLRFDAAKIHALYAAGTTSRDVPAQMAGEVPAS